MNRREMLKFVGNATAAGVAVTSVSVSASSAILSDPTDNDATIVEPKQFVESILKRKFSKMANVSEEEITMFSGRYVAFYGADFDYKGHLKTPLDELLLMKEFVQSVKYKQMA